MPKRTDKHRLPAIRFTRWFETRHWTTAGLEAHLHHCISHGTPSLSPSILVPGQFLKKNVASAHEVICEQWVRPSHLNCTDVVVSLLKGRNP